MYVKKTTYLPVAFLREKYFVVKFVVANLLLIFGPPTKASPVKSLLNRALNIACQPVLRVVIVLLEQTIAKIKNCM